MASGRTKRTTTTVVALTLALTIAVTGCWFGGDDDDVAGVDPPATTVPTTSRPDDTPDVNIEGVVSVDPAGQLGLRLSEGSPVDEASTAVDVVAGTPIEPAEVEAILDRLPPWDVPASDRSEFERPPQPLPPPLVGDTIDGVFPPPGDDSPPEPAEGPLEVVRFQPEGEVDVAPFLSVTFGQPMVPLATLDQLDQLDVPIQVTPEIQGRWRWIGTRTLRFEVEPGALDRLPAATTYEVTVPAGTTSVAGGRLAESVSWSFATPAPSVESFVGEAETTSVLPVFVAVFDQRVDPEAVLATTTVEVEGRDVPIRVATDDEVDADVAARRAVNQALDARAVAFRPVAELPADTAFTVTIGPGTPSAEGPRTSDVAATFRGRTFGSLEVARTDCGGGSGCEPGTPFVIEFTNELDAELFAADLIDVRPAIEQLTIDVYGSVVELSGATLGRTTYQVELAGSLTDVFGQSLGEDTTVDFRVGSARPALLGLPQEWITTDPTADPQVSVTTVNHDSVRVRAWGVSPADIESFRAYLERLWSDEDAEAPQWPVVMDDVVEIDADQDQYVETSIDLSDAFDQVDSQIVVRIDPTQEFSSNDDDYWRNRPTVAWVQSTTVGIDAIFDHERLVIWTTDLATGEPLDGVPVELIGDGRVATTDGEGLAELDIGDSGIVGLWADAGDETAFLPANWYEGWKASERSDEGRWYVFDDRGVYRPGETVRLTGWIRKLGWSADAQLALYDDGVSVRYDAWDAQGNELASGTVDLNALGGFNLTLDLPDGANLGQARVEFRTVGAEGNTASHTSTGHTFPVQEFRRPEFEVTATNETEGPFYVAQPSTVRVDAEYFSGGPLPEADVTWLVSERETTYRPPNWDRYTFGVWVPWWEASRSGGGEFETAPDVASDPCLDCWPGAPIEYEEYAGITDAGGSHYLQIDFDGPEVDLPTTVTAEATVFDVNRQAWSARTDLLVHPAEFYVGLRSDRAFVRQGTPIRIDGVVTDVDGGIVPGREVTVTAGRLEWVLVGGDWTEQIADEETCTFTSTDDVTDTSMRCEFSTQVGGTYRVTATVVDDAGRTNRTELTQWVTGATGRPIRDLEQGMVTIVPDRATYAPGDTAELLVQAPFAPATGIVTIVRGAIVSTEAFGAEDGSAVLEIPIDETHVPNIEVQVDMVGASGRVDDDGNELPDLPEQPAFATGRIGVAVPPVTRALDVVATPADTALEPGQDTSVTVAVTDAAGEPVEGADVAIVVVDEAVLSLTGYELADPLDVFYRDIWTELHSKYMRSSILLTRADLVGRTSGEPSSTVPVAGRSGDGAGDDAAGESTAPDADESGAPNDTDAIVVRENFEALALYAPSESTDAAGEVTVDVPLPDSLTRYRVMAVAIDGAQRFGKGESTITARLPLQVRPSAPRFLNFGDEFDLPVVLQNQTDDPLEVDVAIESANLELTGAVGRTVTVPPDDRIEVRFPATTDEVGTARFRVVAVSGDFSDAAVVALPVYTPATAEAFATYGVVDEGAVAQPTVAPSDVFPQFGGLEVNTSSTALQALTDAVIYLTDYRYESSDGLASRIMAIATLRDVLDAFDAAGLPPTDDLNAAVRADLDALAALQNDDGGFPYWQRGRESIPWQSIQSAHALVLAREADYPVPADTLDRSLRHLASIEQYIPPTYSEQVRNSLSAYALYVRNRAGQADAVKATELYERVGDDLELDAVAWLWPSIVDADLRGEIERRFLNAAVETAGAATFATSYGEDAYVIANSERKTDGIILDALISQAPGSDLIPKVVSGLLGGQTRGRWNNAHENAFILLALDRYFDTFESVTPAFVARVWLGDLYAAEATFDGRTTDRVNTLVPMPQVIAAGDSNIVLSKEGEGRLYYRLGLRYAPSDLRLDPRDEGFVVERLYEAIDDPDDVRRNPDGSWTIRAGAKVRVSLTMVADAVRTHVALIDPLPAGLEPVDPALTASQTTPPPPPDTIDDDDGADSWFCCFNWFEHQNLRDDRAEAFAGYLPGGTYEYTYIARATTPGTFVVPPARAEEIYSPEVFGRSASATVVVE